VRRRWEASWCERRNGSGPREVSEFFPTRQEAERRARLAVKAAIGDAVVQEWAYVDTLEQWAPVGEPHYLMPS
jgi:hypothetical protein